EERMVSRRVARDVERREELHAITHGNAHFELAVAGLHGRDGGGVGAAAALRGSGERHGSHERDERDGPRGTTERGTERHRFSSSGDHGTPGEIPTVTA